MSTEIKAPQFPESVADGTVATWHKAVGEAVSRDELLVDIETDKVVLEVVAPADGVLTTIHKDVGETVLSEEVLGVFEVGAAVSVPPLRQPRPHRQPPPRLRSHRAPGRASPAARKAASEPALNSPRFGVRAATVELPRKMWRGCGRTSVRPARPPQRQGASAPASETLQRLPRGTGGGSVRSGASP